MTEGLSPGVSIGVASERKRSRILVKALEFYSDCLCGNCARGPSKEFFDDGERAREALEKYDDRNSNQDPR